MKKTLTKRVLSVLLSVALLMTMFTGMVFSASAFEVVDTDGTKTVTETYTM